MKGFAIIFFENWRDRKTSKMGYERMLMSRGASKCAGQLDIAP